MILFNFSNLFSFIIIINIVRRFYNSFSFTFLHDNSDLDMIKLSKSYFITSSEMSTKQYV